MKQPVTKVRCTRTECTFYLLDPKSRLTFCKHPDKKFYHSNNCPLFVLDWQKKLGAVESLEQRFGNNHKRNGKTE
jgi:hypothetical protein